MSMGVPDGQSPKPVQLVESRIEVWGIDWWSRARFSKEGT
jgi:hypothetical protein